MMLLLLVYDSKKIVKMSNTILESNLYGVFNKYDMQ